MIKIIIERRVAPELLEHYAKAALDTLSLAVSQPGFISGESLVDARDGCHHVVICSWRDQTSWELWYESRARLECMAHVRPMLQEDEAITVLRPVD